MSGIPRDIEQRLAELSAEPFRKPFWERSLLKIVTIISWILLAAAAAGCIYIYLEWRSTDDNTQTYAEKTKKDKEGMERSKKQVPILEAKLKDIKFVLNYTQSNVTEYKNMTAELRKKIDTLTEETSKINDTLKETEKERDQLKVTHDKLLKEEEQLEKDLRSITHIYKDVNATLTKALRGLMLWKVVSGFGFAGSALLGLNDFVSNTKLWERREEVIQAEAMQKAFPAVSVGYENYTFWNHFNGATVQRTECFRGRRKADLSNCAGKQPTITTIITTTGYRFGVVLTIPWKTTEGTYTDPGAFAFSDNNGAIAKIKASEPTFVVNDDTLIQFGKTDIVVSSDGESGSARAESFDIPANYDKEHFFHNGTKFTAQEIIVEAITFS